MNVKAEVFTTEDIRALRAKVHKHFNSTTNYAVRWCAEQCARTAQTWYNWEIGKTKMSLSQFNRVLNNVESLLSERRTMAN